MENFKENEEIILRRKKMAETQYGYSFEVNSNCNITHIVENSPDFLREIIVAGRIVFFRDLGKLVFLKLQDFHGLVQISLNLEDFSNLNEIKGKLDSGDIIGVKGFLYKTKSGETTIAVKEITPLRKALHPLPDKWQGYQDEELKLRYRYIDCISNEQTKTIFKKRFKIIQAIKNFLIQRDFIEVETPIIQNIASGAAANPFKTHHDALHLDCFLRIAPELYLKRLLIAGFTKVFEMGRCFRNEGIDTTHLQEFTMLEFYQTYISYENLMNMAIELVQTAVKAVSENLIIGEMDFNTIPKISYVDFLKNYGGIDYFRIEDPDYLQEVTKNISISNPDSKQAVLDAVYKHYCVKKIISPILVFDYPRSALSKISDKDSRFSSQFQIIVKGQEIVKSCLEMNDPDIQKQNFEEQAKINETGDNDVVRTDSDFLEALSFGMPPAGGLGLGIDRVVTLLTESSSIRNIVLFPQVKPLIKPLIKPLTTHIK